MHSATTPGAQQQPGGTNDPGSAETQHEHTHGGVQAGGNPVGATSGRENDPCSADSGTGVAGGDIKCNPEESAGQPGRASDPASAERRK